MGENSFVCERNVALKFNRLLRLRNFLLSKIPSARKIPLTGNWPLSRAKVSYQLNFIGQPPRSHLGIEVNSMAHHKVLAFHLAI